MMLENVLAVQTEDKERLHGLLNEIGDIIARSNTVGLELDWVLFCDQMFPQPDEVEVDEVPEVWYTLDDDIGC